MVDMSQFREAFLEESTELVDTMEGILLRLDLAHVESEDLHTLFRVAHSIKGNAATFGFPAIAAFTHQIESCMEPIRQGAVAMSGPLVELLLGAVDLIRKHLYLARRDDAMEPADLATQARLVEQLKAHTVGGDGATGPVSAIASAIPPAAPPPVRGYQIRFTAPPETFRRGINLERTFRDLSRLGKVRFWLDPATLPDLDHLDPEACCLAWDIQLESSAERAEVEEVFEFVNEGENLEIRPLAGDPDEVPPIGELLVEQGEVSPAQLREALARQEKVGEMLVHMGVAKPEAIEKAIEQQQKKRSQAEASTVRVATEKIDRLVNLVGELVITQAMLAQSSQSLETAHGQARFHEALLLLDRQTRELQERVMGVRMVPMDMVFQRFPRMVRELGKQLGKDVALILEGQNTELDKTFIEMLVDPLTHLVRNGIDHGLESTEDRVLAGKPAQGTLTLRAASRGGHIYIEIQDDGRGLDTERILRKAIERGLCAPEARPSPEEIQMFLFEPGFSTAETVSDVSGRGVGLDVVRQNIRQLGGRIEVDSRLGQGTLFRLVLPLTLAILDGLMIQVGDEPYVFPLASVLESFKPKLGEVQTLKGDREVINLRGEFIPIIRLPEVLGVAGPRAERGRNSQPLLVVVESEGRRAAMVVDDLLGQQQVVIKSLEAHYRRVEGVSGATILGDGRVSLILDVPGLIRMDSLNAVG